MSGDRAFKKERKRKGAVKKKRFKMIYANNRKIRQVFSIDYISRNYKDLESDIRAIIRILCNGTYIEIERT